MRARTIMLSLILLGTLAFALLIFISASFFMILAEAGGIGLAIGALVCSLLIGFAISRFQ